MARVESRPEGGESLLKEVGMFVLKVLAFGFLLKLVGPAIGKVVEYLGEKGKELAKTISKD